MYVCVCTCVRGCVRLRERGEGQVSSYRHSHAEYRSWITHAMYDPIVLNAVHLDLPVEVERKEGER